MTMRKILLLATALALSPALAWGQTTEELYNDGKNPDNVLTQSMGLARNSYSPPAQINKSNVKRLVPIWSTSLMNDAGELAAPVVYDGVFSITVEDWRLR
jgi:alcohol dehydrogenase (cytochrome c)